MKKFNWSPKQKDNIMLVANILLIVGALVAFFAILMLIAIALVGAVIWLYKAICSPIPLVALVGVGLFGIGLIGHFITPDEPFNNN